MAMKLGRRVSDIAETTAPQIVWWLLGVITAISITLLSAWAKSTSDRVGKTESALIDIATVKADVINIKDRLSRIDSKLDRVMEKK